MTQATLWDEPQPEVDPQRDSAVGRLVADLDVRMRRAEDPAHRRELMNGHLFWALIRILQNDHIIPLRSATPIYLEGRRWEVGDTVGTRSDGAMFEWLRPTPAVVNTVSAIAEATVMLQLVGDGPPHSSGLWHRVLAVEDPDGSWVWRSIAPWWQADIQPAGYRNRGPRWTPYCDRLPDGAPTGTLVWQPGPDIADYEDIVADLAGWYRQALSTGRRWVCEHGWTHHPRKGDRAQPLSCHREHREDPCDRCCLLANPYGKAA